jgi:hypothetical protein
MIAYICDACGETYKPYFRCDSKKYTEGNGMTIVKIEKDGQMKRKLKLELCPECMKKVFNFVRDDLVKEGAPLFNKANEDQVFVKEANNE